MIVIACHRIHVRPSTEPEELDMIREQIDYIDDITAIDDEVRHR